MSAASRSSSTTRITAPGEGGADPSTGRSLRCGDARIEVDFVRLDSTFNSAGVPLVVVHAGIARGLAGKPLCALHDDGGTKIGQKTSKLNLWLDRGPLNFL
jgi:hypothetical protein